jgi:hypothetical protein
LGCEFPFPYGNKEAKVGKAQFMYFRRGEFHNIHGSSFGKLLVIITPPQFEKSFEEIGMPIVGERSSFQPPPITLTLLNSCKDRGKVWH